MPYVSDIQTTYVESVTIKSIVNDNVYAKDLLEDIDRVRYFFFWIYAGNRKLIKRKFYNDVLAMSDMS